MGSPLRVVLVEDHTLMRAGIRALLQALEDVEVVGEADNGPDAISLVATSRPDLILLDITLPSMNGLEVAERVAKEFGPTRTIILSMHTDAVYVRKALQAGASGYVVKDADVTELEAAIRAVMRGETYLSPGVKGPPAQYLSNDPTEDPLKRLTRRQRETLELMAQGFGTRAIAERLNVSVKTVEFHRAELMNRLEIHDVPGLVRFAIRAGLVSSEH
jgi:DNA-binding NarL/FixJ family response regulator